MSAPATIDQWLGPAEAARRLGCTPQYVSQLADAGRLTCQRTRLGRLIDPASVQHFAEQRQQRLVESGARPTDPTAA